MPLTLHGRIPTRPTCVACGQHPIVALRFTVQDEETEVERTGWSCVRHTRRSLAVLRGRVEAANQRVAELHRRIAAMGR